MISRNELKPIVDKEERISKLIELASKRGENSLAVSFNIPMTLYEKLTGLGYDVKYDDNSERLFIFW